MLALQFVLGILGVATWNMALSVPGAVLGGFAAMYTAFLFAQAKGRDLWQNPALPLHLLTQAALAGAAVYSVAALFLPLSGPSLAVVHATLLASLALHAVLIVSEAVIPHAILDARRAAHQMMYGKYRGFFWTGLVAGALLPLALGFLSGPAVPPALAGALALGGLLAYEHAFVQAGQSVPLS